MLPVIVIQDQQSLHSELSASNDSLSDTNNPKVRQSWVLFMCSVRGLWLKYYGDYHRNSWQPDYVLMPLGKRRTFQWNPQKIPQSSSRGHTCRGERSGDQHVTQNIISDLLVNMLTCIENVPHSKCYYAFSLAEQIYLDLFLNQALHGEHSGSNDSLSKNNSKVSKVWQFFTSAEVFFTNSFHCLLETIGFQEKGGIFSGMFIKFPKPAADASQPEVI